MQDFVIVEVGSTNTKAYLCNDNEVLDLGFKTIEFKNHYKKENKINDNDKKVLFDFINSIDNANVFVFGTSIFRNLDGVSKEEFLKEFKDKTGRDFYIVTPEEENEYTVYGAVSKVKYTGNVAVMIGGGGSTELSIVRNGEIIESCNSSFGAMDVSDNYPDLRSDIATTSYDKMLDETKTLVNKPNNNADVMILAGGDYIYFYEELSYPVIKNTLWSDELEPYMLDTVTMDKLDREFFYNKSLDEICIRTNNEGWWRGARGMRICVKALVDILDVKYIIPTRISMVYG
ncbi:MAG TPA: hypothetical protein IAB40_00980, partial [Candidatus Onthocola stercoravium]|nr:hypothetical protein [Candidatus Onthocola stercoravium]